jgi:hypothetical protein
MRHRSVFVVTTVIRVGGALGWTPAKPRFRRCHEPVMFACFAGYLA